MGQRLGLFLIVCCLARAETISPESLLVELHSEARQQAPHDRLISLNDLAIAATGVNSATSTKWALETFNLAGIAPHELRWQQINQVAARKNALTILSLTDPFSAAKNFIELEPSPAHQPNEDPRIDLSRNLFPRLWAKQGEKSLSKILTLADFTSRTGQYPYVAIGHILPKLAAVDPAAGHQLLLAAVHRLGEERGILRTPDDYLQFLRESWPAVSAEDRRLAVETALGVVQRGVDDTAAAAPGSRSYVEYYLPQGTVRLNSEATARIYDLLPFVESIDVRWSQELRERDPELATVVLPAVDRRPWRAGIFASAGPDMSERVEVGFEKYKLMFLREWASEDPSRAAGLVMGIRDSVRRRTATALVLPAYSKVDPVRAESWLRELSTFGISAGTPADLEFIGKLARAQFALGHPEEARHLTDLAMRSAERVVSRRDRSLPAYFAEGADELYEVAETFGEFQSDKLGELLRQCVGLEPGVRLFVLSGAVRGALRHRSGYQEPI